jgi:hypothetical protein
MGEQQDDRAACRQARSPSASVARSACRRSRAVRHRHVEIDADERALAGHVAEIVEGLS